MFFKRLQTWIRLYPILLWTASLRSPVHLNMLKLSSYKAIFFFYFFCLVGVQSYLLGAACSFSVGSSSVFWGGPLILYSRERRRPFIEVSCSSSSSSIGIPARRNTLAWEAVCIKCLKGATTLNGKVLYVKTPDMLVFYRHSTGLNAPKMHWECIEVHCNEI